MNKKKRRKLLKKVTKTLRRELLVIAMDNYNDKIDRAMAAINYGERVFDETEKEN